MVGEASLIWDFKEMGDPVCLPSRLNSDSEAHRFTASSVLFRNVMRVRVQLKETIGVVYHTIACRLTSFYTIKVEGSSQAS
jgi:hypothetical protein